MVDIKREGNEARSKWIDGVEYILKSLYDDVVQDRRNVAMENARLHKDIADLQQLMRNKKNENEKIEYGLNENDKVRLVPEKEDPLERKVYPNWAFTKRSREKMEINKSIYEELLAKHKVSYSERYAPTSDVVIEIDYLPYSRKYTVLKNKPNLSADEIALLVDNGNLCFGYTGDSLNGSVWID